ncbi:MAG TPA: sulfite exporter TauE/SafE family protein [Burkholderiaceae bacterium]|nr:sulfite exporter TauE/SafE family protein [Burkholderiaceae bacterium]
MSVLAGNAGRISSYAVAGAIAGDMVHVAHAFPLSSIQAGGCWLVNAMLVVLGLYLMNLWHGLVRLEAVGQIM